MSHGLREIAVLAVIFLAVVWFIWTHIANDLPDDFLLKVKQVLRRDKVKGQGDGGLRDHW